MLNAMFFYRIGNFFSKHGIPIVPSIMKFIIRLIYNSVIDCSTQIGEGSFLAYGGIGVVIHKKAKIGRNVTIGQQVTIGGRSGLKQLPVIGNNVYLGAGSKILGDIVIGDNVIVGANSVVIESFPENSVIAGVPAKLIRYSK